MAKRFVDSELWDKEWYMELSLKHKVFMRFLFDKCDAAGVWSANWVLATSYIGEKISEADIIALGSRVRKIADKKYFLDDFISFQYGTLSTGCKPHLRILSLLEKHNIDSKGYPKGIETLEEEEQEEDKDKEKDKGGLGGTVFSLWADEIKNFYNDFRWIEKFCRDKNIRAPDLKLKMAEFVSDLELKEDFKDLKELKNHFTNWFNKNKNGQSNNGTAKLGTSDARIEALKTW